MHRDEMVDFLIDEDIDFIMKEAANDVFELLASYLGSGFKGYGNFTDEELETEVKQREEIRKIKRRGVA